MNVALAPNHGLVRCPGCASLLAGPWAVADDRPAVCERCRSRLQVSVFPALEASQQEALRLGERALEGEASCFFHPEKRAELACEGCGRFLCALCDLAVGSRHLCPSCLAAGATREAVPEFVNRRVNYGTLSLLLAAVPLIPVFSIFSMFTAPAAAFFALYGWRKPGSLVYGKRRFASIVALLLALGEMAVYGLLFFGAWKGWTHRAR